MLAGVVDERILAADLRVVRVKRVVANFRANREISVRLVVEAHGCLVKVAGEEVANERIARANPVTLKPSSSRNHSNCARGIQPLAQSNNTRGRHECRQSCPAVLVLGRQLLRLKN